MKKRILRATIIAGMAVFTLLVACNQPEKSESSENVAYYRHILFSETPYDRIKGTYPIRPEEATEINHYKFDYNDKNQLVSVSFMRGEEMLNGSSLGASKLTIDYTDGMETYSYFDRENQPMSRGSVFNAVYSVNEDGQRTGMKFLDKEGNMVENWNQIAYYNWAVLEDGMVQEKRYNLMDEETVMNEFCPFYELRFSYDENGHCTRMANYMEDTLYDCTVENCGDVGVSYFSFDISENGDLNEFGVYNTVGQYSNLYWGWAKFQNKYDKHGNMIESAYWDQDEEYLGGKRNPVNQYVYDEHGAVIERKYMNADRQLVDNPSNGVAVFKYTYDENGHPADTVRMNSKMEVIQ